MKVWVGERVTSRMAEEGPPPMTGSCDIRPNLWVITDWHENVRSAELRRPAVVHCRLGLSHGRRPSPCEVSPGDPFR